MTASMLFAGDKNRPGEMHCYFCGAPCDDTHRTVDFVKPSFTNRDAVAFPGSEFVCVGCVLSLGVGDDEMKMIDGSIKKRENDRGMQPRMYSWMLTEKKKLAATKAHIKLLRKTILAPPKPPFAIILADSGQKQLIFRAPVALSRDVYPLMLEDKKIEVDVRALAERIALAIPVCAGLGKPALLGEININCFVRFEEFHGDISGLERWLRIREEPLSRLAAWLAPSKEEAQNEYPGINRRTVPAEIGGIDRSRSSDARGKKRGDKDGGDQLYLDFGKPV